MESRLHMPETLADHAALPVQVGEFKLRHPEVYGIDDAGKLMFGRPGREILYWGFNLCAANPTSMHQLVLH